MFEVGGEERGFQGRVDVAEESVLLLRGDGVADHEAEPHQAVRVAVLHEGVRYGCGELDGLAGNRGGPHRDGVRADRARRAGFVAVGDLEAGRGRGAEGGGFFRVVHRVARRLRRGELRVEDPEVGGAGVDVHHQRLPADLDGREELRVAFLRRGLRAAGLLGVGGGGGGAVGGVDDRRVHAFGHGPPVFAVCSC